MSSALPAAICPRRIDQADRCRRRSRAREHVRERAAEFAGAEDGDVMHAWAIVMAAMDKHSSRTRSPSSPADHAASASAIARALVAEGVNVAITGRTEADLSEARRHIEAAGPGTVETLARRRARSTPTWTTSCRATVARFGGLDILVNNAGVGDLRQRRRHDARAVVRGHRHESHRRLQRLPRGAAAAEAARRRLHHQHQQPGREERVCRRGARTARRSRD